MPAARRCRNPFGLQLLEYAYFGYLPITAEHDVKELEYLLNLAKMFLLDAAVTETIEMMLCKRAVHKVSGLLGC